ncbi:MULTISPECIES: hypothetical protein [Serratia]|jgi:hypothetical protein|uniref:Uncharacterized protein n=1 Tax=Serratia fonticola TaxID=47917 RepID=A0AAP7KBD6_SERFO|nr:MULTISPECIES: hypothetical protein [Serratia]MBC3215772.1 hypothetical protein [Serratia fonticola]MBC3215800.1 hypothetical protein [Serratia fonticola]NYA16286.1 hypothetical protein [Serratia fonticola]NYA16349.1 hypothetical protein [Serratia fonticola]NYA36445.1 hypothetical protein [Serratia fonticola]
MKVSNLLPFSYSPYPNNYPRYVEGTPVANDVIAGYITTGTTTIEVSVTENFVHDGYDRFVLYSQNGQGPYAVGMVDAHRHVEIHIFTPLSVGVSYLLYANDHNNSRLAPVMILPNVPQ